MTFLQKFMKGYEIMKLWKVKKLWKYEKLWNYAELVNYSQMNLLGFSTHDESLHYDAG